MEIDKEGNIIYTEDLIYELGTSDPRWSKVVGSGEKEDMIYEV